jgi:pyrroline-5-carboxylate reductase
VIVLAVKPQQMRDVAGAAAAAGCAAAAAVDRGRHPRRRPVALAGRLRRHRAHHAEYAGADRQGITGMVAMAGVERRPAPAADSIMRAVGQTVWLDEEA